MKVWGVNETQLQICADEVGVALYELRKDGRALRFRIKPTGERREGNYRYQRTTASMWGNPDRKVHAVCWHGHRDFMRAVFAREPEARIKTGWADYRGSENFEAIFEATGDRNVGSIMYPVAASDVCNCRMGLFDPAPRHDGIVTTHIMRQDTIRGCKFFIFTPEHYRPDGTCKCDDAEHRAMMIREWEYSESDFEGIPLREGVRG